MACGPARSAPVAAEKNSAASMQVASATLAEAVAHRPLASRAADFKDFYRKIDIPAHGK